MPEHAEKVEDQAAVGRAESYQRLYRYMNSILTPTKVRVMTSHYVRQFTLPIITRRVMLSNRNRANAYVVSARRTFRLSDPAGETLNRPAAA